jgi:hypothetical protein
MVLAQQAPAQQPQYPPPSASPIINTQQPQQPGQWPAQQQMSPNMMLPEKKKSHTRAIIAIIVSAIVIASACFGYYYLTNNSGSGQTNQDFFDDFSDYSSAANQNFQSIWTIWKAPSQYGTVSTSIETVGLSDKILTCDLTNAPSTATAVGFDAKDVIASDFSLEFDLKDFDKGSGGPTLVTSAGMDFKSGSENCYRFVIQYSQQYGQIREVLFKVPDRHAWPQHPSILDSTSWRTASFPQIHHYEIVCEGISISILSDNAATPIITATDSSLISGYIGTYFESGNGNGGAIEAWASFDNIRLTHL